jgi:phospholipid transport system substrate-binding protein
MLRKITIFTLACVLSLAIFNNAIAADPAPLALMKSTANKMISQLQKNTARYRNPSNLYGLVKRILLPVVDQNSMARSVVGPRYWKKASASQRKQFIAQFGKLVTRTYSTALADYEGQTVSFNPIRGSIAGKKRVQISSFIQQPGGHAIPVSYRLVRSGSAWKVYDFSVDGISIVRSYRSQFSSILQSSGISGLLQKMSSHNRGRG